MSEIIEEPLSNQLKQLFELLGLKPPRVFKMGECSIFVGHENGKWHLSISHPSRNPTWEEIKQARYALIPNDVWMAILLPPKEHYINVHEHCFHLWEVDAGAFFKEKSVVAILATKWKEKEGDEHVAKQEAATNKELS